MRKLWYEGMKRMPDDTKLHGFVCFANAVQQASIDLHGAASAAQAAVVAAYTEIGIYPKPASGVRDTGL